MAVTTVGFVAFFPEFADAPLSLVSQYLAYAVTQTPPGLWGNYTEEGSYLRAAQNLALSPFARKMGLANDDGVTVYDARLARLVRIVAAGGSYT